MNALHPLRALCALVLLASFATAQTITLSETGLLVRGETITVTLEDPSKANQTVNITVSNGDLDPYFESVEIQVTLDANGKGKVEWVVHDRWDFAHFSCPGVPEESRGIVDQS